MLDYRITARYGATRALNEFEDRIAPGEVVALVGLSGSGKSTLALALLGLLHYRGGEVTGSIRLNDRELTTLRQSEWRRLRGLSIGYVPQSPAAALNPRLKVLTLLKETWSAHSTHAPSEWFLKELLESVQLPGTPDFAKKRAGELSAGQGQRLLIALAIMHKPTVLIADEPTSALDAITQAAVLKLLRDLNEREKMSMLFISHDLLSVAALGHRVTILHEGRNVESGTPDQIFHTPNHPFTQELVRAMPRPW